MDTGSLPTGQHAGDEIDDAGVYCVRCGYDLRGQAGDVKRCPECGHEEKYGGDTPPSCIVEKQLRAMETGPAASLAGVLIAGFTLIPFLDKDLFSDSAAMRAVGLVAWTCYGLSLAAVFWMGGAMAFRRSCGAKPGWRRAFALVHLYGGIATILPVLAVAWLVERPQTSDPCGFPLLCFLALLGYAPVAIQIVRRRLRNVLFPLQWELAAFRAKRDWHPTNVGLSRLTSGDAKTSMLECAKQMDTSPPNSVQPAIEANGDLNLYCIECGYNLRGQVGDPRRCPECGRLNPVATLLVPAKLINRQLKLMETAPACSLVGLSLILVPLMCVLIYGGGREAWMFLGHASLWGFPIWITGLLMFRHSCQARPGWAGAFARFYWYTLLACAGVPPLVLLPRFLPLGHLNGVCLLQMAWAGVVLVYIVFAGRWARRRFRETVHPLQRETAVAIVQRHFSRSSDHRETTLAEKPPSDWRPGF